MVLPSPAPDDAPRPYEPGWLERLTLILRLAERGVIALVDRGRPERLGELVRAIARQAPDLEVYADARRLAEAPKGAVVVLAVDPAQADWLNIERPIVAHRELRLVLFSDAETSAVLARRAVDFFHWISHRIECPEGAVMPAVRTIRQALCARARGIAWGGGDLRAALDAALPGRPLSIVSAGLPYEELVEAARPRGRGWVAFTEADSVFRGRRVHWALAEAGRRGRAVLVEASKSIPGFWPAHGKVKPLEDAVKALTEAGAAHAGRLGAMLDLEPEAIDLAAELLRGGVEERVIEGAAAVSDDPGAELVRLAEEGKLRLKMSPPVGRRFGRALTKKMEAKGSAIELLIRTREQDSKTWDGRVNTALAAGDPEVAERWSEQWLKTRPDEARALYFLGTALLRRGEVARAVETLRASTELYERASSLDPSYSEALCKFGAALLMGGKLEDAEKALRRSLALTQERVGKEHRSTIKPLSLLSDVLLEKGRYTDALQLLTRAAAVNKSQYSEVQTNSIAFLLARGHMLLEQGADTKAEALFRKLLNNPQFQPEAPLHSTLLYELGRALIAQGRYVEAESSLRQALATTEKLSRRVPLGLLIALGSALLEQGKHTQAEHFYRRALVDAERSGHTRWYLENLYQLGRTLLEQGNYAEAKPLLQEAKEIAATAFGLEHPDYTASIHALAQIAIHDGLVSEAETMLRDVLAIEQRTLGRDHPMLSRTLSDLAEAIALQDRPSDAERLLKRALRIAQTSGSPAELADILKQLALVQNAMGRRDATDTARRALATYVNALGEDHPTTVDASAELQPIIGKGPHRP